MTLPTSGWLRGLSVSVVSIYYAPDSTGIAPYATDFCRTLAGEGAAVHAVVGVPHYPQWTVDARYRSGLRFDEQRDGVRLTRVRHFVPRHQDVARRGLYELSFYAAARAVTARHRPDVVLGVTPNLGGAAAAAALAARRSAPLGIVVQDLVGLAAGQSGMPGGRGLARRIAAAEAKVLRGADLVGMITPAFEHPLVGRGVPVERTVPLPNHSRLRRAETSAQDARRQLGWPVHPRIVVHSGNMGLKQGLVTVVEAARLAWGRRDDLLFVLVGAGSTRAGLERLASGLPTVRFVDPLPDDRYPLALAAADVLLVNERGSVVDMSMPSKLTSYLAAGRPVIAATTATGATAAEVRRSGGGLVVGPDDPRLLLDAVEHLVDDPVLAARLASAGARFAATELSAAAARERTVAFVRRLLECGRGIGARR